MILNLSIKPTGTKYPKAKKSSRDFSKGLQIKAEALPVLLRFPRGIIGNMLYKTLYQEQFPDSKEEFQSSEQYPFTIHYVTQVSFFSLKFACV